MRRRAGHPPNRVMSVCLSPRARTPCSRWCPHPSTGRRAPLASLSVVRDSSAALAGNPMTTVQAAALLTRRPTAWCAVPYTDDLIDLEDRAPAFQAEFVRRPALVRRLTSARNAALAVLVAPPGYGKSSLLAEWAQEDERPFLWLAPSRSDARASSRSEPREKAPGRQLGPGLRRAELVRDAAGDR